MSIFPTYKGLSADLVDASASNTARNHDRKEPWLSSTMTAKHKNCKEQQLQRRMAAKKSDRKERWLPAIKQWLQRTVTAKSSFGRKPRPEALFLHLQLADSEGNLAQKLRFHIFKEVRTKASFSHLQLADFEGGSHESFLCNLCATSTCRFWRKSRTKTSFSSACS